LVWQYLTLYVQFCAPGDERRNRLKHVEQFIEINRSRKRCILLVVLYRYSCEARTYERQNNNLLIVESRHIKSFFLTICIGGRDWVFIHCNTWHVIFIRVKIAVAGRTLICLLHGMWTKHCAKDIKHFKVCGTTLRHCWCKTLTCPQNWPIQCR